MLEFAHVEVPAIENIAIIGTGSDQHLGLHVFPGQKKLNRDILSDLGAAIVGGLGMAPSPQFCRSP